MDVQTCSGRAQILKEKKRVHARTYTCVRACVRRFTERTIERGTEADHDGGKHVPVHHMSRASRHASRHDLSMDENAFVESLVRTTPEARQYMEYEANESIRNTSQGQSERNVCRQLKVISVRLP